MVTFIAVNGKKISVRFFDYYEGIKNVATVKGVTREIYLAKFLNDKKSVINNTIITSGTKSILFNIFDVELNDFV